MTNLPVGGIAEKRPEKNVAHGKRPTECGTNEKDDFAQKKQRKYRLRDGVRKT
jgi:hypothetical protein